MQRAAALAAKVTRNFARPILPHHPLVTSQLILELAPVPAPTLQNFVPGRNRAVVEALVGLAAGRAPDQVLYVWGEPGTGKSHLLTGAWSEARYAQRAAHLVEYCADLDARIEESGLLVVDDVDTLPESAQARLFDVFNRVRAARGAFVAAGTCAPARLRLRQDLGSRVLSGLVLQCQRVQDAGEAAALAAHAVERGIKLPRDVVTYFLHRVPRDTGTLFAVLEAIDRYSLARQRPVTLPLVREALAMLELR